mmetsp:Transcript_18195/g.21793  ORF Transcript_18195/g.21793 Transcript_18195/m.21793 type:complete len:448 (+) Transcript_18195:3-1346(+)
MLETHIRTSDARQANITAQLERDRVRATHAQAADNSGVSPQPAWNSSSSQPSSHPSPVPSAGQLCHGRGRSYLAVAKPHRNLDPSGEKKGDSSFADDYSDNEVGSDDEDFAENYSGSRRGVLHQRRMKSINGGRVFGGPLGARSSELDYPETDIMAEVGTDGLTRKKLSNRMPTETEWWQWINSLHRHWVQRIAAHGTGSVWEWRCALGEWLMDYFTSSQAKGEVYAVRYAMALAVEDATSHPSWDPLSPFAQAVRRRAFSSVAVTPAIDEAHTRYQLYLGVGGHSRELQALRFARSSELKLQDPVPPTKAPGSTTVPNPLLCTGDVGTLLASLLSLATSQQSAGGVKQGTLPTGDAGGGKPAGKTGDKTPKPCYACKTPPNPAHSSSWHAKNGLPFENTCPDCGHEGHTRIGPCASKCQFPGCDCDVHPDAKPLWKDGIVPKQKGC